MKKRILSLCMAVAMLLSCLCITPAAAADAKFTKDYISGVLQAADLNAEVLMPDVTADDVYLSAKIPFAFDYAGKDAQVAPGSKWEAENLEHGTHVAGIAAGYAVDGEGAVTGVSCTVLLDGYDYDYGAAYASQPLPAPDGTLPTDTYQVNGLTLLVYDDGAVGWYDTSAGIQWYCVAWDGGAPLVTAFTLMDAQYYTVPTAPEGADVLGYDLFDLNGETVTEVSFTLNSVTWHYRMAPTLDVSETIPDISAFTGGSLTAEGRLRWCPTVLRWDAGGAGCIIWRDIAPGLAYSLTADTGASEKTLADMAALVFKPAQEES